MNKLVLTFILLKLSYSMILGAFDYALEQIENVIPVNVIENQVEQSPLNSENFSEKLSVDR
jgi:hypothetical protein